MKWKRILKIGLLVMAIVLIVVAGLRWWFLSQLEHRLTVLREAGAPISVADLEPKPVPPNENAATYLARISQDAGKLRDELDPILYREDSNWRVELTPDQISATEEAFEAYPNVLPSLERAANCRTYVWPHDFTLAAHDFLSVYMESLNQWRNYARVLDYRAVYLNSVARHDEAAQMYLQQLRLARLQAREPLLVGFLVNMAIRQVAISGLNDIVQTAPLAPETHTAIETELAVHDSMDSFIHALKTERAFGIESFREITGVASLLTWEWIEYLDFMQQQIQTGDKLAYERENVPAGTHASLTAAFEPGLLSADVSRNRVRTLTRCVRIVNALYAQEIEDQAIDLATLGLPPATLIDPFSGNRLLHEKTPLGWKVGNREVIKDGRVDVGVAPPSEVQ